MFVLGLVQDAPMQRHLAKETLQKNCSSPLSGSNLATKGTTIVYQRGICLACLDGITVMFLVLPILSWLTLPMFAQSMSGFFLLHLCNYIFSLAIGCILVSNASMQHFVEAGGVWRCLRKF